MCLGAAEYLYFHRILVQPNDKNYLHGLWGKLASEILMQNWDTALEEVKRLQTFIDESTFSSSLQTLQQRTWLVHWSLFVFFNHPKGRELVIEMFLYQKQYLNAIQTTCPWILRYLSTAVIINKSNRRNVLKDLVKVIQEEAYTYRDPITSFIEDLYVKFDFDGAQQKLRECETVLVNDFFLVACLEDFIENSRLMIFETFCRIHQCISISMLAEKLNMTPEDAERWIVNLIRNAKLDAKVRDLGKKLSTVGGVGHVSSLAPDRLSAWPRGDGHADHVPLPDADREDQGAELSQPDAAGERGEEEEGPGAAQLGNGRLLSPASFSPTSSCFDPAPRPRWRGAPATSTGGRSIERVPLC